jgi:hypothetical protein
MCVVSMIGDHYRDKWEPKYPDWVKWPEPTRTVQPFNPIPVITRQEFDDLKREVLEMKELLKRAKAYDEQNNEPDCEMDDKVALLRKIAALVGVSLDDVLKPVGD